MASVLSDEIPCHPKLDPMSMRNFFGLGILHEKQGANSN